MRTKPATDYVKQCVIYQIHPRVFTKEGTLKAAETHLPRLAELGVDILYLLPVFVADDDMDRTGWSASQKASGMDNPRNPYRMKDYYNIDPEYGTNEDFRDFVDKAHELGMKVMIDVVFFHCGPGAVFLKQHPDFVKRNEDGQISTGGWNFPIINHANPELREYLIKNMEFWARDFSVDGFRADVASSVPLSFWETARERLEKINPEVIMLAEGLTKNNQRKAFDLDYMFEWYQTLQRIYQGKSPASDVRKTWTTAVQKALPGTRYIHYLESHDTTCKTLNWKRPNKIWGTETVDTALVLNFTVDGAPWLYNGQEIADTARHNIHATKGSLTIDWANADTPGGKARFALCRKLCKLRHTEKALTEGTMTWLDNSAPNEVVSFLRTIGNEQVLVLINMTKRDVVVEVAFSADATSDFRPLLAREAKETAAADRKKTFALKGCGFFVGKGKATAPADDHPEARFAAMSAEEVRAYEVDVMRRIADLALMPPKLNTSPLPEYDYDQLDYGMTIGIARTPGGRIWAAWVGGEDGPKAFMIAATSDDNGDTWSKPRLVIDSRSPKHPMPRSVIVGNLWTDPLGRLWFFFDQTMRHFDGRGGMWAAVCENPDADEPTWSKPRRLWHGCVLNKPTVLASGEWMLPAYLLQNPGFGRFAGIFPELDSFRGVNVFVSSDQGETWERRARIPFPDPDWHEPMIVELKEGRLWMLARTRKGVAETFSEDDGHTWSMPVYPARIRHPNARFHLRRLASGRIILVKHGERIDAHEGRCKLTAWLSDDEGETWQGGLMLDERTGISYPDGFQAPDGTIYISYDRNRSTDGEVLLARFTEDDVLARGLVDQASRLKMLISRPLKARK